MATIYELKESYMVIQQAIEAGEDLEPILETLDAAIEEKADGYASIIANLTSDIEGLKAEEKRLNERRKSYEKSIERLKANLFDCMNTTGKTKFKTNLFSFAIQKNGGTPPLIMKVDTSELPDNLVIIEEKPDKKAIIEYIKKTGDVTFAEIGESGYSLRIK